MITMSIDEVLEKIEGLMGDQESVTVSRSDLTNVEQEAFQSVRMRTDLARLHHVVVDNAPNEITFFCVLLRDEVSDAQ
jgi:hypothetical protein